MPLNRIPRVCSRQNMNQFGPSVWSVRGGATRFRPCASSILDTSVDWSREARALLKELSYVDDELVALTIAVKTNWEPELTRDVWKKVLWATFLSNNKSKDNILMRISK